MAEVNDGPDPETLTAIVGDVFIGLLGERAEAPWPADHAGIVLPVTAMVGVSGGWSGLLEFSCSDSLARRVTAEMLEIRADEVSNDDVRDVLGEFANVIGGNVKSVMPGPSTLSLPLTSLAGESAPLDSVELLRLELAWRDEPIRVSVWVFAGATC